MNVNEIDIIIKYGLKCNIITNNIILIIIEISGIYLLSIFLRFKIITVNDNII